MPNVPMIFPSLSRQGNLVVSAHVTRPSGVGFRFHFADDRVAGANDFLFILVTLRARVPC